VISFSGDGGFTMLMGDFVSLVQLGLPVKVVVFKQRLSRLRRARAASRGFLDSGTSLQKPKLCGGRTGGRRSGIRLEDPVEVDAGVAEALATDGPCCWTPS